ncbi:MAG: carboxypeptidase-like regulatory domain-containing protein [Actinomycetota bacterium]|nr:carboxypeptidase-like regulatory domain-containing protein [Actinomycetota bacterium]
MSLLTGTITVHGREPAESAVVEVLNASGDVLDQVQVDHGGRYRYHLGAGMWTLRVWDAQGHRGRAEVQLGEEDKVFDLDLDDG